MSQTISQPQPTPPATGKSILRARGVQKTFQMGDSMIQVLKGADLTIRQGEFVAIEGRSGSGKSTLLHICGALDASDGGTVEFDGSDIASFSAADRSKLRNRSFGFVFQFYHLLPELNVLENTLLACMIEHSFLNYRAKYRELRDRAANILKQLGMDHRLKHRPAHLSGGERQRVAIARALINSPQILFADEPTGNLDTETGGQIMRVLESLHQSNGQTIVMVTHDRTLARQADRVLVLKEGKLERAES